MGNDRAARGDKTSNDRVANRFGRCFDRKKERFDLKQLRAGDHIVEERWFICIPIYWHHMIVVKVDINQNQIGVIHYYNKRGPSGSGSVVCPNRFTYTPDRFYRIVYEHNECLRAAEVLKKAEEIKRNQDTYNLLLNNCEHFANKCKTGKKECHQKWTLFEILAECSIPTVVSYVVTSFQSGRLEESDMEKIMELGAKISPKLAIIVALIFETYFLYRDCCDTKAKLDEGKLTREEFCNVIVKRVFATLSSIVSHWIVFFWLPEIKWFALGSFLGGYVLPVLGTIAVGTAGDYLAKLGGAFLAEQIITPLFIEVLIKEKRQ